MLLINASVLFMPFASSNRIAGVCLSGQYCRDRWIAEILALQFINCQEKHKTKAAQECFYWAAFVSK